MLTKFVILGAVGWCLEVIWTGIGSLLKGNFRLSSKTSIWMFFIYGSGAFLAPFVHMLLPIPLPLRGLIYVVVIYAVEFAAGYALKRFEMIPWDYSETRANVMGIIRLDYAPLWFGVGLLFEFVVVRL
jgi:uncharacterized membrane protein